MPPQLTPPLAPPLPEPSDRWSLWHQAVDWPVPTGTPVLAAGSGKVIGTPYQLTGGLMVHIDHGEGIETNYAHLLSRMVSKGDMVRAGQQIALSGASGITTGAHLHFGVRVNGAWVDPLPYLSGKAAPGAIEKAADKQYGDYYPVPPSAVRSANPCAPGYTLQAVSADLLTLIPAPAGPYGIHWSAAAKASDYPDLVTRPPAPEHQSRDWRVACVHQSIPEGQQGPLNIKLDLGPVVPLVLNGAVVVAAAVLAWSGLQRILGR